MILFCNLVSSTMCAKIFSIPNAKKTAFRNMVEIVHSLSNVCQEWAINNLAFENDVNNLGNIDCIGSNE